MAPRCSRCGVAFEPGRVGQSRCRPCEGDVARLIEQDAARRVARFPNASDRTTWAAR
jgi:hypothetical protein